MTKLRRRLKAVMAREVDDGVLLLDTESDRIHQLNQTASFIWSRCDEVASAEEIAVLLAKEFGIDEVSPRGPSQALRFPDRARSGPCSC
jgi:hypothetical protein